MTPALGYELHGVALIFFSHAKRGAVAQWQTEAQAAELVTTAGLMNRSSKTAERPVLYLPGKFQQYMQ